MDSRVPEIKQLRQDIDGILQRVKQLGCAVSLPKPVGEESEVYELLPTPIVRERLTEATMWLGQCLKVIGEADPYPHSRDANSAIIEPTADNLKY
jgi:hypothetical protein